jgi:RimJ/RimL family protein N-acetyltransferase
MIGDCALHVDSSGRQGEIGFTLSRQGQGRGFATEAVSRLCDYVFLELKLHRLVAICDCRNQASVALLERLSFRREGHFLENIYFKGAWGDEYLFAMRRTEWLGRVTGREEGDVHTG